MVVRSWSRWSSKNRQYDYPNHQNRQPGNRKAISPFYQKSIRCKPGSKNIKLFIEFIVFKESDALIAQNFETVLLKIAAALKRSGRPPGSVRLVAVSKTVSPDRIRQAIEVGLLEFGENRVQEAQSKISELRKSGLIWHLIGHLQKNKVKYIFDLFDRIDSVDSLELAESIHLGAQKRGMVFPILIQVNVAREKAKFGLDPDKLETVLKRLSGMNGVRVEGLMTITPFDPNPEKSRPYYAKLRNLRDQMLSLGIENIEMQELSMGMTNDFSIAIEEGATMVRVGTAIFGER